MPGEKFQGRYASVYLPEKDVLIDWQNEAKRGGASISEYIYEMVERSRRPIEDAPRPDLSREISDLQSLNRKLVQENNHLKKNLENAQAEIYKLRFGGFDQVDAHGFGEYDSTLVGMLKRGKVLDSKEILAGLGIDPRDSQAIKLVTNQLEELRRFGLVHENALGWRWIK